MNETTFIVNWTYVDQFGNDRRESETNFETLEMAKEWARFYIESYDYETWWIDSATTVHIHNNGDKE